jgi:protocatechuate 3,4-dioxygenase alpha subunit
MTLPATPSQTVGPYYSLGLCRRADNELVPPDDPGAVRLRGAVYDGDGAPVDDAVVEIWDGVAGRWGRSATDADGRFGFTIAKPAGANGEAPRLDAYVFARGLLKHQLTRVYFPDEAEANAGDPVLSSLDGDERATLVAEPVDGALRFDIRMQGARQTVFFAV